MALLYSVKDLFRGKVVIASRLYELLEDLDKRISKGVEPKLTVKKNVKLTPTDLKKAFGSKFNSIGIVHNNEGSYLIVADGKKFKHISLVNI